MEDGTVYTWGSNVSGQLGLGDLDADFMREPTYLPLGAYYPQTVFSAKLTGMRSGLPQFYDIRWA